MNSYRDTGESEQVNLPVLIRSVVRLLTLIVMKPQS